MNEQSIKVMDKESRAPFYVIFCYQERLLRHRILTEPSGRERDAENAKSNNKEKKKM